MAIGPSFGHYPGQPGTRSFTVELERLSAPYVVLLDGRRLPQRGDRSSNGWSYDAATHTLVVRVDDLPLHAGAVITEIDGTPISAGEPAAVDLSINPSTPLTVPAGGSATVSTTEQNDDPGSARGVTVSLTAPSGWTVKPAAPVSAGDLSDGASSTQSWTVTAPADSTSMTAALQAEATYTSAGRTERVLTTEQGAPAPAPPPPPVITGATPASSAPGTPVTLTGQNFGTTQGSSYLTLAQGGTSWGAPYDGAKLTITSWSDTSISFDLPPDSGPFPLVPGSATVTVTVAPGTSPPQTSQAQTLTITGTVAPTPSISSVQPSSTTAGTSVTLTGQNFGSPQGSSYLTLAQGATSWGAPYDGAKVTITSWSDTSITFDLPPSTGPFPIAPGTATITVTAGGQTSNTETITITS